MVTSYSSYSTPTNDYWDKLFKPPAPATTPVTGGGLYPSTPNPGQGAFGKVPGSVDIPAPVSGAISRDLSGILSPEVQSKLQNIAATWGIRNGMPGSGAQANLYAHDYLGASDAARQRGFENWKSLVPLMQSNNELAAAPNPETRALTEQSFAQQMFNQYLAAMRGGGGVGGSPFGGGGNQSPGAGTIAQPTAPARTGGIDAVANPLPNPNLPSSFDAPPPVSIDDQNDPFSDYWGGIFGADPEEF